MCQLTAHHSVSHRAIGDQASRLCLSLLRTCIGIPGRQGCCKSHLPAFCTRLQRCIELLGPPAWGQVLGSPAVQAAQASSGSICSLALWVLQQIRLLSVACVVICSRFGQLGLVTVV